MSKGNVCVLTKMKFFCSLFLNLCLLIILYFVAKAYIF